MTSSGIPSFAQPYTEAVATTFITKAMDKYNELKDLSDLESLHELMKVFSSAYFQLKNFKVQMCKVLMLKGYTQITCTILQNLMKRGYFSCDEVWFPTYYVYNTLWNFCDFDQEIATSINDTELPKLLAANMLYKPYLDNLDNTNTYYLMKASVSIVHNVARFPGNQGPYNSKEIKNTLVSLIRRNNSDFLGLISMLALSVLVDESELQLLEEGKNTISSLIEHIKTAQSREDKRYDGFNVWELVNSLRCLSANDNMKKTIVENGGLPVLISVLNQPSNNDDVEKTLGTIWNLCFDKEIRETLTKDYDIKSVIKRYENNQYPIIKRSYDGIIWLLDNKSHSVERVKSASVSKRKSQKNEEWKFDIFLSYSWSEKPMVLNIKNELEKSKIKIWIDVDQMKGSTLEAMADGIENSKIFVMAVSESYRTSPNCRTEAEYAFSLKKPTIPLIMEYKYKPTSWLGLIMGSKMYHEFSERRVFQETIGALLKNITDLLNNSMEERIIPQQTVTQGRDQTDSGPSQPTSSAIETWSKADVAKWLAKSQLNSWKPRFAEIDGVLLHSMIELSSKAPDYLYQTLKTEFGMKLVDILKFNVAFRNLSLN